MQFVLHSGGTGGATQLVSQGISELHIQRTRRGKSRALMAYVGEEGKGGNLVLAALAKS